MNSIILKKSLYGSFAAIIITTCWVLIIPATAQQEETTESAGMRVERIIICTSVVEREPVGEGESFPADIKKLFCFTDVRDIGAETFITHEWYYKDELKATVKLKVAGEQWRTWSSKGIDKNWTGQWRVEVKDSTAGLLSSVTFIVGEESSVQTTETATETKDAETETKDAENENKNKE